jgi:hypothetical protein
MKWVRVNEHGVDVCYLRPDDGETERVIVAAVAAASFNSAWPEGYGWEQWDPTDEVTIADVRKKMPDVFKSARRRAGPGRDDELLAMDYIAGRRCKTYLYRERRGGSCGALRFDATTYEATRGDVERLLRAADMLLGARRPSKGARPG